MKHIYLIIALLVFSIVNAQEAELFNNIWYLRTVQIDDLAHMYDVSEMNPPIAPYLKISEDFSFNGNGACNSFNGTYSFYPPNNMEATDFVATSDDCGVPEHNLFEDHYFWFISGEFQYYLTQDNEGAVLTMGNVIGGTAVFTSYPLSTLDFDRNDFSLYPNPVKNELLLSSRNTSGKLNIKIFNIEGKLLSTQNLKFETQASIDVSNLSSGIYFLNIEDERGNTTIKKFVKE